MNVKKIQKILQDFADEREWDQFHTPKNLVMALSGEVGELTEIFQWLTEEESRNIVRSKEVMEKIEQEIADIQIYLIRLAQKLDVPIEDSVMKKIKKNAEKYPIHLAKGSSKKYTEY